MNQKDSKKSSDKSNAKVGQGYNDARGEIPDQKDIPKHNGQNVDNDPSHYRPSTQKEK